MISRRLAAIAVLVGAVLLAGCGVQPGSTASTPASAAFGSLAATTVLTDPKSYEGPSTAVLPDADITPVTEHPAQSLPATVLSHDRSGERSVTVADTSRVIAMDLSGSLAATVWGLGFGDTLVGRDVSSTFPSIAKLPVVTGGGHSVTAESVIALRPTLVITDGTIGPTDVIEQLRDVGITVVFVQGNSSLDGAVEMSRAVAAIYGAPAAGDLLAERTQASIAQAVADIDAIAPTEPDRRLRMVFLYLRGASGVYYLFGTESGADQLITAIGGVDVAGELGWGGMRPLTDEAMVAANPDLIIVMTSGLESVGGVDALLAAKPAIALTIAGEHRRIVDMADGAVLSFGPRTGEVLEALARAVYAPEQG